MPSTTKDLGSALGLFYFLCELLALVRIFRTPCLLCFAAVVMIFAPCFATHLNIHSHSGDADWFIASDRAATSLANE